MKRYIGVFALALAGIACHHQAPPTLTAAPEASTTTVKVKSEHSSEYLAASTSGKPDDVLDSITTQTVNVPASAALRALRGYDLSPLWQGKDGNLSEERVRAMDGFFGKNYRRIAFAFTEIHRDNQRPDIYWVKGKDRFQKIISPFEGTIKVVSITRLDPVFLSNQQAFLDVDTTSQVFTVKAYFDLREPQNRNDAGAFTGTGYLDFSVDSEGRLNKTISMMQPTSATPAKGAGVLYKGQWINYSSQSRKPLLLSGNVFITAPTALPNFGIGDRDITFNPKYAKLGWNTYWENDEWWADTPKPSLSL